MKEKFDRTKTQLNVADIGMDKNLSPEEAKLKFMKQKEIMKAIPMGPKAKEAWYALIDESQQALEQQVLDQQEKSSRPRR